MHLNLLLSMHHITTATHNHRPRPLGSHSPYPYYEDAKSRRRSSSFLMYLGGGGSSIPPPVHYFPPRLQFDRATLTVMRVAGAPQTLL